MELFYSPDAWIALVTLTALEIVLGIDNIIFISILTGKLPQHKQPRARLIGLSLAMLMRNVVRGLRTAGIDGFVPWSAADLYLPAVDRTKYMGFPFMTICVYSESHGVVRRRFRGAGDFLPPGL